MGPMMRWRIARDCSEAPAATSRKSCCGKASAWCPDCCHGRAAVICRCRAMATTCWRRPSAGALDNLRLTQMEVPPPSEGQVQVRVQAAGLNFRDVLNVLGLYPGDPGAVGGELAGIGHRSGSRRGPNSRSGKASSDSGRAARSPVVSTCRCNSWRSTPPALGAIAAASTPAAVLTARLAFDWARLGPGDRVLDPRRQRRRRSGGGATGPAAWCDGLRHRQHLQASDVAEDGRGTRLRLAQPDFADQIMADTGGAGVDVVLNSLTNDGFVAATVRATAAERPFCRDRQARHLVAGGHGGGAAGYRLRDSGVGRHHAIRSRADPAC